MSELDELYQSVILDHNRAPRNFRKLPEATNHAEGRNPLCGDQFDVWLKLEGEVIADAAFQGQGCAISKASASMMTQAVKGKTVAEARALFEKFHEVVTGTVGAKALPSKLDVFRGVSAFPIRVKCATLSWHAMRAALDATDIPT
jgi:nitrogen fixation NifU-like protein